MIWELNISKSNDFSKMQNFHRDKVNSWIEFEMISFLLHLDEILTQWFQLNQNNKRKNIQILGNLFFSCTSNLFPIFELFFSCQIVSTVVQRNISLTFCIIRRSNILRHCFFSSNFFIGNFCVFGNNIFIWWIVEKHKKNCERFDCVFYTIFIFSKILKMLKNEMKLFHLNYCYSFWCEVSLST